MRSAYSTLRAHFESPWSVGMAFAWGFAEATVFFIVPDVYLGLAMLMNWRRGLLACVATVVGAMLGGALMYALAQRDPIAVNSLLARIPLITESMLRATGASMRLGGLDAMLGDLFRGVPFKIYAAQAGELRLPLSSFLWITILVRLARLLPVVLVAGGLGLRFKDLIRKWALPVLAAYACLWAVIYLLYYLHVR